MKYNRDSVKKEQMKLKLVEGEMTGLSLNRLAVLLKASNQKNINFRSRRVVRQENFLSLQRISTQNIPESQKQSEGEEEKSEIVESGPNANLDT